MAISCSFEFLEITDDEVRWASELLDLPKSAFLGESGNDPRKHVIQSGSNRDVAACPGSGKTTVLVAKLAILAQKWRYRTKGICVLSHTNVARSEIETRLGNTSEGQRLLSYPHFIGTIHGFVDQFLAIPWLKSLGYPVKVVESDFCEKLRWKKIAANWSTRVYLEKKSVGPHDFRIVNAAFDVDKKKGSFPCQVSTNTYRTVQSACKETTAEGYHCYDDMFVWACDLLSLFPGVRNSIRNRFPLFFLDEAQDNREEQSSLLHQIFVGDQPAVIRQRFGDGNQAIYSFTGEEAATTYKFPDESITISLPKSFRFGQTIANLADTLGLVPYSMCGQGPKAKMLASGKSEGKHTIFAFDESDIERVLDAYGALLLDTFSDQELQKGTFTAVGMVHKQKDREETKTNHPHRVGDYWSSYDPENARLESSPKTFVQHLQAGVAASIASGEAHHAVEKIAEGILRLATMASQSKGYAGRKHRHRFILETLRVAPDQSALYLKLLTSVTTGQADFTEQLWETQWRSAIHGIANTISGGSLAGPEVDEFLSWRQVTLGTTGETKQGKHHNNIYSYRNAHREVRIKVGSIHSIKGQTHTATLVLETAWHGRNLGHLMPWLCGEPPKASKKGEKQQRTRLKTHYVAMTRPSHLLCLALHKQSLFDSNGKPDQSLLDKLKQRGWDVVGI